eukprot:g716.t1
MSLFASLGSAEDVDHSLWGEGGLFGSNPVQDILDRGEGEFTLEELLEEEELIQEVKHLNGKLIKFLSQRETVRKLVAYVTRDDTNDEADVMKAAEEAESEARTEGSIGTSANAAVADSPGEPANAPSADANPDAETDAGATPSASPAELAASNEAAPGEDGRNEAKQGPPEGMLEVLREKERLGRFAYTASEIFCCEVPGVNHHLLEMEGVPSPGDNVPSRPDTIPEDKPMSDEAPTVSGGTSDEAVASTLGVKRDDVSDGVGATEMPKEGPLISQFFGVLHRPEVSPRTAGYLEKIVDVFIQRDSDVSRVTRYVNDNPELLPRFVHHLSMISVSNVFRKLLDSTDVTPLPVDENHSPEGNTETFGNLIDSDGEDDDMPPPMSESDIMAMTFGKRGRAPQSSMNGAIDGGGDSRRRILWAGKLAPKIIKLDKSEGGAPIKSGSSGSGEGSGECQSASVAIVESLVSVFREKECADDKYVSASDALIDVVNRSTAQETILSLQSDDPPSNVATGLMRALNTPDVVKMLIDSATDVETTKTAVQGCLSVLVRLIEWHAQNLQAEADAALATVDDIDGNIDDVAEAETPKAGALEERGHAFEREQHPSDTSSTVVPLPLLVAEILRHMPRLVDDLLSNRTEVPTRRFSNGNKRVPFGLVRLQAVAACMREHRVLLKCLDLAMEYELNNVLHSVVLQSITSMCEEFDLASTVEDYRALFGSSSSREDSNLVDTILDAYENSDRLKKIRGYQSCYLGHLHIMANAVHDASIKAAQIMEANPAAAELIKQKNEKMGESGAEEKTLKVALSSLKPPPPASNAEESAAQQSQAAGTNGFPAAMPPSEYKRASSLASPRVTGIQLADVLENSDPDRIESLDLGLALNEDQLDNLRDMEPYDLNADGSTSSSDDDDDDDDNDLDPKKLAELQDRYGFSSGPSSSAGGTADGGEGGNPQVDGTSGTTATTSSSHNDDDGDWGFVTSDGMFDKDDADGESFADGVNLGGDGDDDDWGFASDAGASEEKAPPVPEATSNAAPILPPPSAIGVSYVCVSRPFFHFSAYPGIEFHQSYDCTDHERVVPSMVRGNSARRKELAARRRQDRKDEVARKRAGAARATPVEARARILAFCAEGREARAWVASGVNGKGICESMLRLGECDSKRCRLSHELVLAHLSGMPEVSGDGVGGACASGGGRQSKTSKRRLRTNPLASLVCVPLSEVKAGGQLAYDPKVRTQRRQKSDLYFVEVEGVLAYDKFNPFVFARWAATHTTTSCTTPSPNTGDVVGEHDE